MLKQLQYNKDTNKWTGQLYGDLDAIQAPKVVAAISSCFGQQPADIILNCKALDFIDSMGLGALVKIRKLVIEKNHNISLTYLKPRIYKLFVITGLEQMFEIEVDN